MCYFHTKSTQNIQELLFNTGRIFSGNLKKWSSDIVNESVLRLVLKYSFKCQFWLVENLNRFCLNSYTVIIPQASFDQVVNVRWTNYLILIYVLFSIGTIVLIWSTWWKLKQRNIASLRFIYRALQFSTLYLKSLFWIEFIVYLHFSKFWNFLNSTINIVYLSLQNCGINLLIFLL